MTVSATTRRAMSMPRRWSTVPSYLVAFLLYLVANAFAGNTQGLHLPIGPERLLLGASLLLLVLDVRTHWRALHLGVLQLVALIVVAWATASAYLAGTLMTSLGFFALVDRLVIPYVLFTLAPVIFPDGRSRLLLLQMLTLLGLYLGVTAVFEVVGPHALIFPRFIANPDVGIGYGRARGPFLASDADGAVMAMCLFSGWATWFIVRSVGWRTLCIISGAFCVIGIFLTLTRAEWIGAGLALIVVALLDSRTRRLLPLALVTIALLIGVSLAASTTLRAKVEARTTTSRSVEDRENTNAAALRIIQQRPLTGVGWVEFIDVSDRYVRQSANYPITNTEIEVHNVVLSRLAELGVVGGGLWVLTAILGPVAAVFARRQPGVVDRWVGIAAVGIGIDWLLVIMFSPFPYPLPNALVWLFSGLVLGRGASGESLQDVLS